VRYLITIEGYTYGDEFPTKPMTDIDVRILSLLMEKGVAVIGTAERAMCRDDALTCVDLLSCHRVAILGGDVYYVRGSGLEPAYENWYVERVAGEPEPVFLERSYATAREYIQAFPERPGRRPLFVITVQGMK